MTIVGMNARPTDENIMLPQLVSFQSSLRRPMISEAEADADAGLQVMAGAESLLRPSRNRQPPDCLAVVEDDHVAYVDPHYKPARRVEFDDPSEVKRELGRGIDCDARQPLPVKAHEARPRFGEQAD